MCGSAARTDLYGGQLAIAVPTVTGTYPTTLAEGDAGVFAGRTELEMQDETFTIKGLLSRGAFYPTRLLLVPEILHRHQSRRAVRLRSGWRPAVDA